MKADQNAHLQFSAAFDESEYDVEVRNVAVFPSQDGWTVPVNGTLLDAIEVNDERIARGIAKALMRRTGSMLKRNDVLNMPIPVTNQQHVEWDAALARHDVATTAEELHAVIRELDMIVGGCFGLTDPELNELRNDLQTDPFLSKIRPIYPGSQRRLQGLREGLDSSTRYA